MKNIIIIFLLFLSSCIPIETEPIQTKSIVLNKTPEKLTFLFLGDTIIDNNLYDFVNSGDTFIIEYSNKFVISREDTINIKTTIKRYILKDSILNL